MPNLYVRLADGDLVELRALAAEELRDPRDQAAVLILEGLRSRRAKRGTESTLRRVSETAPAR
jgi:hypothetical protein